MNGFKEIHKMRFLHRDIKADNILVNDGIFKIADFGLAKNQSIGETVKIIIKIALLIFFFFK